MLRSAKVLTGYRLGAADGEIGRVKDFYFDERHWTIRYLVADTTLGLGGHPVLLSPLALGPASDEDEQVRVSLTSDEIMQAPDIDTARPVSRQQEILFNNHYGWPHYWQGGGVWASGAFPALHPEEPTGQPTVNADEDPGLHNVKEVLGYGIQALDGTIGHVEDFILDDRSWTIRYLVIDTNVWWFGKHVLVAPGWLEGVVWNDRQVTVSLTRRQIQDAPEWDGESPITGEYEQELARHYGRPLHPDQAA